MILAPKGTHDEHHASPWRAARFVERLTGASGAAILKFRLIRRNAATRPKRCSGRESPIVRCANRIFVLIPVIEGELSYGW